jgi:hypothetical protein
MWTLGLLISCALAAPTPERQVLRALPDCDKADAVVPDAVPILLELAGTSLDLKARERAAACLLERHPERAEEAIADWMGELSHAPLVELVLERLDTLPPSVAVGAATAGLRGPHAERVTPAVQASELPIVRATLMIDSE